MPLKIEHRTGVQAPAEVVWEMIADVSRWPDWSGIYSQASGVIGFGELLTLTLALPGEPAQVITPRVLDWAPSEAVHWRLSSAGGLISSVRYIEIERMHEAGCVFSNGELFGGLLGGRLARSRRALLRRAFTTFGEAVRDRAEAAWRARPEGTT